MTSVKAAAPDDLAVLLPDWRTSLRAAGRQPHTISAYLTVGEAFRRFATSNGMPTTVGAITREHLEQYLADMQDRGLAPNTVAKHYRSLQQLFRWLTTDGEIPFSPMRNMSRPFVPEQAVPILSDEVLAKLLATCRGDTFENRRDAAIIRLFIDTGMRAGELAGLNVDDIDRELPVAMVLGKGNRARACPYGAKTADALRRYLRWLAQASRLVIAASVAWEERTHHRQRGAADARTTLCRGRHSTGLAASI